MTGSVEPPDGPNDDPQRSEQVRVQHVSARVPERVGRGSFSTGAIVMTGGSEFVVDFVQHIGGPASVVARVVVPHGVMPQFIQALRKNLDMYIDRFGQPPPLPQKPADRQLSAQELYDELKIPDDLLSGAYANALMISHSAAEFRFDFLTNLFPTSAVSARVFVSAPHVPRLLTSLSTTFEQFQQRVKQQRDDPRSGPSSIPPTQNDPDFEPDSE